MKTVPTNKIRWCLLVLPVLAAAVAAPAEPAAATGPPVGRTYYTTAVGLDAGYDVQAQCFEFHRDKVCTLDGLICGSWAPTGGTRSEQGLSFDLTTIAGDDLMVLEGRARLDARGPKSSIAGTGRIGAVDGDGAGVNFSFAAREVGRAECLNLLEQFPGDGDGTGIVGSGVIASETREVSGFDGLLAAGVGLIEIRHGATESLRITADDNLLPILTSEVRNGRLVLGADARFSTRNDVRYEITVRDFDEIVLTGVFGVEIEGLDTDRFEVNLSGVSSVTASSNV